MIFASDEARDEFKAYIDQELDDALSENTAQQTTWKKWRRQREARPEGETATGGPWPGSSHLSVPLSNITGQTMYGQLMGALGFVKPFMAAVPMNKKDPVEVRKMKTLTKYLGILNESPYEVDLKRKNRTILYETGTMGTGWVKVFWDDTPWSFVKGDGTVASGRMHHGVNVVPIPLEDVLHRQLIQDPAKMPWIAHRLYMPKYELEDLVAEGDLSDPERDVLDYEVDVTSEAKRDSQRRQGVTGTSDRSVRRLFEIQARWDANGDGKTEEIVVLYHRETRVILQEYWNPIGVRTLLPSNYIERPFFVEGMGTCWLSEYMQDEVDVTHNIRVDSMHLTTMPIFSAKKQSGIKPDEILRPGKILQLDQADSIRQLTTGTAIQWSERSESLAVEYGRRATGASEAMGGFADTTVRSGETLGGQTQRLQQGTRMVHSVVDSLKGFYGQVGLLMVFHLVDHKEEVIKKESMIGRMSLEEIADITSVLEMDVEDIPNRMTFEIRAADVDETVQQKRQDLLFRIQLQNMFYDRLTPVAIQLSNPQLPAEAKVFMTQVYTASCRTLEMVLEFFDEAEPDKFVPEYEKLEMFNEVLQVMYDSRFEKMLSQMTGGAYVPRERPQRFVGSGVQPGAGGQPAFGGGQPQAPVGGESSPGPGAPPGPGMA